MCLIGRCVYVLWCVGLRVRIISAYMHVSSIFVYVRLCAGAYGLYGCIFVWMVCGHVWPCAVIDGVRARLAMCAVKDGVAIHQPLAPIATPQTAPTRTFFFADSVSPARHGLRGLKKETGCTSRRTGERPPVASTTQASYTDAATPLVATAAAPLAPVMATTVSAVAIGASAPGQVGVAAATAPAAATLRLELHTLPPAPSCTAVPLATATVPWPASVAMLLAAVRRRLADAYTGDGDASGLWNHCGHGGMQLWWLDAEGDAIVLATTGDLQEALRLCPDRLRLLVGGRSGGGSGAPEACV